MWPTLLWFTFGYASCVWDCSSYPIDLRWPSATGVFVVLLAMRVPLFSTWGAAVCGLVMDAAQGGPLGPRVLAGVISAAFISHANLRRTETPWSRAAFVSITAIALWLVTPLAATGGPVKLAQSLSMSTVSTTLIVMALWSLTRLKVDSAGD